jgi:DNA ligase-1
MRRLAVLTEELESRAGDADRVDALERHLRAVGPEAGALAAEWLVDAGRLPSRARPARLTPAALAQAAAALAADHGVPPWLFDTGRAAASEAAEAIALLLPWPAAGAADARPALAGWLACWEAASRQADRARAVAAAIAALDDPLARRWAVRAVCGLVKPLVGEWQWQRAWARAFDAPAHAVAWAWHRLGAAHHADPRAPGLRAATPHPAEAVAPAAAAQEAHAALLAGWRAGELAAEPRWSGLRVQIVRRGDDVAIWSRVEGLLNRRLPDALVEAARWPDAGELEAVLIAWHAGRPVAPGEVLALPPAKRTATLHLALTDWRADGLAPARRRARLHARWPAWTPAGAGTPPDVFANPTLPHPAPLPAHGHASELEAIASAGRGVGWSGLVLRGAGAPAVAWSVRASPLRVRALLQYVPSEALGAPPAAAAALAFVDCGFALWSRAPLSDDERQRATAAALAGESIEPPPGAPELGELRLLPLARLPIALPDDELAPLQAWLRAHAGARFGAVHAVAPALVFELGFEQVRASRRHKLGAVLVGARVLRWLRAAAPADAHRAVDLPPADPG